ncbi:MAG: hypothetical protein Ct9H300mP28_26610 [Pseudomonadota bacterium]|nr:MAG: hypothetical protein Ct9H300mP28_26610 [Pseudomonadota bacterium]
MYILVYFKINNFLNAITGFEMWIINWEGKEKLIKTNLNRLGHLQKKS